MSLLSASVSDTPSGFWRINVSGQVYGPYTGQQIKAFASEGRLAPHSIVQTGDQGPWITAIDDPVLGQLFVKAPLPVVQPIAKTPAEKVAAVEAPQPVAAPEVTSANFVVVADIRSRGSMPFEAALNKLGDNYRLNPIVWLLHTDRTAGAIRNELVQHLGQNDNLFIVDATRGKTAWFNLGPEPDAKIRRVWKRTGEKG
ncbi:MAG: GYF domain-containing protein, partial [Alphaproteobacteria bacterium]|nr:GYF domain-containing protein [Alphaproteobacteria bacterium]